MKDIDWDEIKTIWQTGIGSLTEEAVANGITLPNIMLKARKEKWGGRASEADFKKVEDLDFDKVTLAYRKSMLKIKKLSDAILESLTCETNSTIKIDALDTLSRIMSRIMPLSISASDYRGIAGVDDKALAATIRTQQIKAAKRGDIKMLMFLGKQHLGQREQLDLFTKDILSGMDPKEAARMYQNMLNESPDD